MSIFQGTTGKPKVVVISHFSMVNNAYFISKRNEMMTKHHTACLQNPLFHAFGIIVAIAGGMISASTLVFPDAGFDPEKILDAIKEEK